MTRRQKIGKILESPDFSKSDKAIVEWQFLSQGDFINVLWVAIVLADEDNLERLGRGFPVEVQGYKDWCTGDLPARLRAAGLDI